MSTKHTPEIAVSLLAKRLIAAAPSEKEITALRTAIAKATGEESR